MVRLAILWHMHQPFYEDLATGEHVLPWVRLHALKDYWGMAALVREFPGIKVTFNLVPSLLVQVQAFAENRADDRHLQVGLKPADALDSGERAFLVAHGFHAPFERMIKPIPRYAELYQRRHRVDAFTTTDLRDLQVLHKLVWMDVDWLSRDVRLLRLAHKQRHYNEDDKHALRDVELELLNAVVPQYRDLAAAGHIELSTSPFYHPILPLLCDSDVHFQAHPRSVLAPGLFRRPTDALEQLRRATSYHRATFGNEVAGVWPSEGSLSAEVIGLLAECGVRWTASDEGLLARTLGRPITPDDLYRPYELGVEGKTVRCLFRDRALSDLIGFTYQSWDAETAASDFVVRVRKAAPAREARDDAATVSVILDGENAWEHYTDGGRPFLRALYRKLQAAGDIELVTMLEAASGPARRLESIFPGSWIDADFYIWAGHRDDHRAWQQLATAREMFELKSASVDADRREQAWQELLIAEGSDWFWWYGDDHSSDHDPVFDELFRRHLRNAYRGLGEAPPDDLYVTNITTRLPAEVIRSATLITPRLGTTGSLAGAWAGAQPMRLPSGSTMHRGQTLVHRLHFALDRSNAYLRIEGSDLTSGLRSSRLYVAVLTGRPMQRRIDLGPNDWMITGAVAEIVLPFTSLAAQATDTVSLWVLLTADGQVVEQHPGSEPIEFEVPTRHADARQWHV